MSNLEKLANLSGKTFAAGQDVFVEGARGDTMFIIHTGSVEILRQAGGGEEKLATLGPGEFFGEMALVDEGSRSATARASAEAILVPITRDFLFRYARKDAGFIVLVLQALNERLESTDRLLLEKYASMEISPMTPEELISRKEPKSAAFLKSFRDVSDPSTYLKVGRGEVVFRQGEPGQEMFIILEGQVRISQQDGGNMFALAELGRGDFFGEMALISGHTRTATATTLTSSTLMTVTADQFRTRASRDPDVILHLVQIMIIRLRYALKALS